MRIFKSLFFIIINILMVTVLNFILLKPSILKLKIQEINQANKTDNAYNFITLGQSLINSGIDPEILDKKLGVNSYNCALGAEQISTINYLFDEITKSKKVKTIVLGLNATYWTGVDSDGMGTGVLEFATEPVTKIKYFCKELLHKQFTHLGMYSLNKAMVLNIPVYMKVKINKLYRHPTDNSLEWASTYIAENNPQGIRNCYQYKPRGFSYGIALRPESNVSYKPLYFSGDEVPNAKIVSFENLVENCRKSNIELICISSAMSPHRLREENYSEVHDYFKSLCEQNHVPYYDMTYAKKLKSRTDNDYLDWDGHMMGPMAENQTELLCDVLQSENPEEFFFTNYSELLHAMNIGL